MENRELISKIQREYEILQTVNETKRTEKIKKAYEKEPKLKEIDDLINKTGHEGMMKILSSGKDAEKNKKEVLKKIEELQKKRDEILKNSGIKKSYNEADYRCKLCKDTGFVKEKRCKCFEDRIIKENLKTSNLGNLLSYSDFNEFSLDYYNGKNRELVSDALNCSKQFVNNFEKENYNLFFYGKTGLGKTFLSSIIANNVLKNGKSVIYVCSTKMFSLYQDYRFRDYTLKRDIDNLYNCDLLVIDDLGSENTNREEISFLFDLINNRLINNKKIIINTNYEISDFTKVYTVRLTSRIYENFKIFKFEGEDIRIKKLMNK